MSNFLDRFRSVYNIECLLCLPFLLVALAFYLLEQNGLFVSKGVVHKEHWLVSALFISANVIVYFSTPILAVALGGKVAFGLFGFNSIFSSSIVAQFTLLILSCVATVLVHKYFIAIAALCVGLMACIGTIKKVTAYKVAYACLLLLLPIETLTNMWFWVVIGGAVFVYFWHKQDANKTPEQRAKEKRKKEDMHRLLNGRLGTKEPAYFSEDDD